MKKTVVYLLITALLFSLTGCIGLSKKHGFGELIILGDNLTREADPKQGETEPQPVSEETTVKIGGETKKLGERFVLRNGIYNAVIADGKYNAIVKVEVKVNQKQTLKPTALLKKPAFNALKFTFDPKTFARKSVDNPEQINEVYLKGSITAEDWSRLDKMTKNTDGTWSVIVPAVTDENLEFGFVYWLDTDGDGVSDYPNNEWGEWAGSNPKTNQNYKVSEAKAEGFVEDIVGMKMIFDPETFGGKQVDNPDQINEVYVKGSITADDWSRLDALTKNENGTWSVIVPAVTDKTLEFGFVYWLDTDGNGVSDYPDDELGVWAGSNPDTGGNYKVSEAEAARIILFDF
ncbi:MAG TPA: hypothetical protein GXX33_09690 [Firmicutes bacterium]|nr:hypothetical protein [Bacillota bacterium]